MRSRDQSCHQRSGGQRDKRPVLRTSLPEPQQKEVLLGQRGAGARAEPLGAPRHRGLPCLVRLCRRKGQTKGRRLCSRATCSRPLSSETWPSGGWRRHSAC